VRGYRETKIFASLSNSLENLVAGEGLEPPTRGL
jgi:hypothetical protein